MSNSSPQTIKWPQPEVSCMLNKSRGNTELWGNPQIRATAWIFSCYQYWLEFTWRKQENEHIMLPPISNSWKQSRNISWLMILNAIECYWEVKNKRMDASLPSHSHQRSSKCTINAVSDPYPGLKPNWKVPDKLFLLPESPQAAILYNLERKDLETKQNLFRIVGSKMVPWGCKSLPVFLEIVELSPPSKRNYPLPESKYSLFPEPMTSQEGHVLEK